MVPIPEPPPWTSSTSPGWMLAVMKTLDQTVQVTSGNAAASSRLTPAGTGSSGRRVRRPLRIPTAGKQGTDLVADGPVVDAVAQLLDAAAHLETRVCRRAGRGVVVPLALHDVGPVDAGGDHLDDDLARPRHRVGHVVEHECVGSAGFREGDCLHGSTLWRCPRRLIL